MQHRIESNSLRWFDELGTTRFARVETRDEPEPFSSSVYECRTEPTLDEPRDRASGHLDLGEPGLVALPRRRPRPAPVVTAWAMVLAAVAGASAFVLGVALVSLL